MSRPPVERRLRTVSRMALYGSLALVGAVAWMLLDLAGAPLLEQHGETWDRTDWAALEEVQLLREYVRIDTSEATGDVVAGARFLAERLREAGLEPHLELLGEDAANLWAVVEGEEPGAVVLHHHIDVSDVEDPEGWHRPPFAAEIDLPWLYGRGTYDMKSIGVAQLLAVTDLVRSGVRPRKSVILLATSGEETGSELGTRWVLREHPELAERFELVLTEGGSVEARTRDDIKYWGTEVAQKRFATLVLCSPSRELLEQLEGDVMEVGGGLDRRLYLTDEVRSFLSHYALTRDRADFRAVLADPARVLRDRGDFHILPPYLKAMFRNELQSLGVRPSPGGGWELRVAVHLLPGVELEEVRTELIPPWLFWGVEATLRTEPSALHGSPPDHPALEAIGEVLHERYPRAPVGPVFLPWTATDSRFFRAHGIPSYGFSPFLILTTDAIRADRAGERISLPDFTEGVEIYRELLRRLVG
ncbi:MAG TPA: M20/M25/M40 family metallo-hydrolase [Thermoanaerobaculia bacterium]|nr:M20/M25/M40 family metallo-hydrolase [Thermoanaerobaculia bacterium]